MELKEFLSPEQMAIFKHKEETGHTKFTVLGQGNNRKKHQVNWRLVKCKECGENIGT